MCLNKWRPYRGSLLLQQVVHTITQYLLVLMNWRYTLVEEMIMGSLDQATRMTKMCLALWRHLMVRKWYRQGAASIIQQWLLMMERCIASVGMIVGSLACRHLWIVINRMLLLCLKRQHLYVFRRKLKVLRAVRQHVGTIIQWGYQMDSYIHGERMIQGSLGLGISVNESWFLQWSRILVIKKQCKWLVDVTILQLYHVMRYIQSNNVFRLWLGLFIRKEQSWLVRRWNHYKPK